LPSCLRPNSCKAVSIAIGDHGTDEGLLYICRQEALTVKTGIAPPVAQYAPANQQAATFDFDGHSSENRC
jgi:hypothetical protein